MHGHQIWINEKNQTQGKWGVFLDRDGVVIEDTHLLHDMKNYQIFPQAIQAIKLLNDASIPVILTTNQTVVSRGLVDESFVKRTHQRIVKDLQKENARLDGIFACLHSPHADVIDYRVDCDWRKPNIGMFEYAAQKMQINLKKSFGVGDKIRDCLACQKVGMQDILVQTGHGGEDVIYEGTAKIIKKDLLAAVKEVIL